MTRAAWIVAPALLAIAASLTAANALYVVGQTQQAVLLHLGRPTEAVNGGPSPDEAGLHVKWPFTEQVVRLDRRGLPLQTEAMEVVSPGRGAVTLRAKMRYRIFDPLQFYRALGDARSGSGRLSQMLEDSFHRALFGASVRDLDDDKRPARDKTMLDELRRQAAARRLGVEISEVSLVDSTPSPSEVQAITHRMQEAEALQVGQVRAEGEQHRRELLAQADREAADVRGEAERQALEIRGDGDAQRASILGEAYGKDPDFARFFRRLEAYDQALNPDNTTLVLSQDNAFLDLFTHGPAGSGKTAP